jgi:abortive infection bacteriophage resistance protein
MHCISYVRNLCAHHARLWNRKFTIQPMMANAYRSDLSDNSRFYAQAFVIHVLLRIIAPGTDWWTRLMALVQKSRFVDVRAMGFANTPPAPIK